MENLFSMSGAILAISAFFLCLILTAYGHLKLHRIWMAFNFVVGLWGVGAFIIGRVENPDVALFVLRVVHVPIAFIPILNYHVIHELCGLREKKILFLGYAQAFIFSVLSLISDQFIPSVRWVFNSFYFDQPGPLFFIFIPLWFFFVGYSYVKLFQAFLKSSGRLKTQILYFLFATLVGFIGGATNFLPVLGINLYPLGNFTIPFYCFIVSYAILKHQLLDIKVVLTRIAMWGLLCTVILGISLLGLTILGGSWIAKANLFSIGGLTLAISAFLLCVLLMIYGRTRLHQIWLIFNFVVGLWGLGAFIIGGIEKSSAALLFWRIVYLAIIFIPVLNYHVVYELCQLREKRILFFIYFQAVIFSILSLSSAHFIPSVRLVFNSYYYDQAGPIFWIFLPLWFSIVSYSYVRLFQVFLKSAGRLRTQILYFFFGTLVGFFGGATNFLPALGMDFYPFGNFTIPLYCFIVSYAVMKYQLLDIKITVTRIGIFVIVYSLVLGIPFGLAIWGREWLTGVFGQGWFWAPMLTLLIFATAGPFIYLFIQRKAEERLLQDQRRYQNTLRQASMGMARIKDINRLLKLIVHVLSRTVRLEHCSVYLLDGTKGNYLLKASRGLDSRTKEAIKELEEDSALIEQLKNDRKPVVYEEINLRSMDTKEERLAQLASNVKELKAEVVVPSLEDQNLIAVLVLGKKKTGEIYSADDLLVFSILADQSALAIENALFYEETGKSLAEQFHEKRLKFLGELGSGVAHQMNNRFNVMTMAAGIGLEEIGEKDLGTLNREDLIGLVNSNKKILEKVENSALKGREIAEAIKTYSKASVVPSAVTFEKCVSSSLNLLACKFKIEKLNIKKEYAPDIYVWANLSTLQEVISNAVDNSHDAIRTKEDLIKARKLQAGEYIPQLIIKAVADDDKLKIEIMDNGIGMTPEQLDKVFVPFFTTKGSSKGTGMGLNMMKQLLEKNKGTIAIDSKYEEGTTVTLRVHLATNEQIKGAKEERGEL